jgi:CSLREA domain-containing protein
MKARPQFTLLFVFLALALVAFGATTAFARVDNVIVVNSTDDTYIPGDGKCTLREAINNANNDSLMLPNSPDCANGFGADIIELGTNLAYKMTVIDSGEGIGDPNGMPVITSNITINGHGSFLYRDPDLATPAFRIFKINFSGILTLNDLDMAYGLSPNDGGGLWNEGSLIMNNSSIKHSRGDRGGGIYTKSYLELNHSAVSNNTSNNGSNAGPTAGYDGGGIYSSSTGKLEIADSSLKNNITGIGGTSGPTTANSGHGGAIYSLGTLKITHSTLRNNKTGAGNGNGGAFFLGSSATILDTTIANNEADDGGGIYNNAGTLSIYRSAISGNIATRGGGVFSNSALNSYNSTIANNEAMEGSATFTNATSYISYNTIAQNNTFTDGAVEVNGGVLTVNNTIIANNTLSMNCYVGPGASLVNGGNNIDSSTDCGFGSANGSMSSTNPKIFALANNGGPTWTMAIAPDSPARDKGDTGICKDPNGGIFNIDQRGYLRIKVPSDLCDIGAYEYNAAPAPVNPTATRTPTITPTNVPPGVTATPTNTPAPPTATYTPDPCPSAPFAPALKAPPNGATVDSTEPKLTWFASSCAEYYNVTVRIKNTVVEQGLGLTDLKYRPGPLTPGKKYNWSVEACNGNGCNTSEIRRFNVAP